MPASLKRGWAAKRSKTVPEGVRDCFCTSLPRKAAQIVQKCKHPHEVRHRTSNRTVLHRIELFDIEVELCHTLLRSKHPKQQQRASNGRSTGFPSPRLRIYFSLILSGFSVLYGRLTAFTRWLVSPAVSGLPERERERELIVCKCGSGMIDLSQK